MAELTDTLKALDYRGERQKTVVMHDIAHTLEMAGYAIVELNDQKPWGAYMRIDGAQADQFVAEFFPDLSPKEARLGDESAELSPKILIAAPGERLSWQKHNRRAERWTFLTPGMYYKSDTDEQGELKAASVGDVLQFEKGESHRLNGLPEAYVVVAEIWQHTDAAHPSDEDDIVRMQDDYQR